MGHCLAIPGLHRPVSGMALIRVNQFMADQKPRSSASDTPSDEQAARLPSPKLTMLLAIRASLRILAPITVIWGVVAWSFVGWPYAVGYAAVTWNYVLVFMLTWIARTAMQGPWRVRPIQTFIVLANSFVLPWVYYSRGWAIPWGFVGMCVIYHIGLVISTYIFLYLKDRLPMAAAFAPRREAAKRGQLPAEQKGRPPTSG